MYVVQIGIIIASFLIAVFVYFRRSGIGKDRKRRQERTAVKPVSETAEMISAVIEPEQKPPKEPIADNTVNFCPKCGTSIKVTETASTERYRSEKAEKQEKNEKNEKNIKPLQQPSEKDC